MLSEFESKLNTCAFENGWGFDGETSTVTMPDGFAVRASVIFRGVKLHCSNGRVGLVESPFIRRVSSRGLAAFIQELKK